LGGDHFGYDYAALKLTGAAARRSSTSFATIISMATFGTFRPPVGSENHSRAGQAVARRLGKVILPLALHGPPFEFIRLRALAERMGAKNTEGQRCFSAQSRAFSVIHRQSRDPPY
jgi:hypothetical protein